MTALNDILTWSMERPEWQRDALRRIVSNASLSESDVDDLLHLCLAEHGIEDPEHPAPVLDALAAAHITADAGGGAAVRLTCLNDLDNVNALADNQEMNFGRDGLTIIFGYNGSGKSGYARILKSLCHARDRGGPILSNAFSDEEQSPSANLTYELGNVSKTVHWQQDAEPLPELRQVNFFDSDCATVHVDEVNDLAFTPFGLDVLPRLAELCRRLNDKISGLINQEEQAQPNSLRIPEAAEGTQVRTALASLGPDSRIEEFQLLAQLNSREEERIRELREVLGNDPTARANELRQALRRLEHLQANISQIGSGLGDDAVRGVQARLNDLLSARSAANLAAEQAFNSQPLPGVGSETWRKLWEAARRYSTEHAYVDQQFPQTDGGARCVLCLQELQPEAADRLQSFEDFIKRDTQRAANQAQQELSVAISGLRRITTGLSIYRDCLGDLRSHDRELGRSVARFARQAWRIQQKIIRSCRDLDWREPIRLIEEPVIATVLDSLRQRIRELDAAAQGEQRRAMQSELNELVARRWLGQVLEDVQVDIFRRQRLEALQNAKRDVGTAQITRKSSELTDQYVTDALQNQFIQESRSLGANYLPVQLIPVGGQFGHKQFQITLIGLQQDVAVREVLSEGEFRCIALAAFLAELSTEHTGSALVFDDPVSSVDHLWRRRIARRLADVAIDRQVIVFTHDVVFLAELVGHCHDRIPIRQTTVLRGPERPGECMDGLPWEAAKVKDRIGQLRNWLQQAQASFRHGDMEAYDLEARRIYGRLRETWERAVEEVLLNGVIFRFSREVHTQPLRKLVDIVEDDIRTVDQAMTKASRFLEGHDDPAAAADPVPDPDEIAQDISDLDAYVRDIRRRRN